MSTRSRSYPWWKKPTGPQPHPDWEAAQDTWYAKLHPSAKPNRAPYLSHSMQYEFMRIDWVACIERKLHEAAQREWRRVNEAPEPPFDPWSYWGFRYPAPSLSDQTPTPCKQCGGIYVCLCGIPA